MTKLYAATDIFGEILFHGVFPDRNQFGELMRYLKSLGVERLEWIVDDVWTLYDEYPHGFDLLAEVVDAAHAQGIELHAVYKPFEGALHNYYLPHDAPCPGGTTSAFPGDCGCDGHEPAMQAVPMWLDRRGLLPVVRPFVAEHPEMCMELHPDLQAVKPLDCSTAPFVDECHGRRSGVTALQYNGTARGREPGQAYISTPRHGPAELARGVNRLCQAEDRAVHTIRLLLDPDAPFDVPADSVSLWTGQCNGRIEPCECALNIRDYLDTVRVCGEDIACRVLAVEGVNIPADRAYVELRIDPARATYTTMPDVTDGPLQLLDSDGHSMPVSLALPRGNRWEVLWLKHRDPTFRQLVRWAHTPEAQRFLDDEDTIQKLVEGTRLYYQNVAGGDGLMPDGTITVVRGRARYMPGVLNPVYPEVREHWLERIRFCLDRGVDGINIRHSYHIRMTSREYGFNPPVLQACGGTADFRQASQVIGKAYGEFMRQASELVRGAGRQFGAHLMADVLMPLELRDYFGRGAIHPAIGADWETWVEQLLDYAEFRGDVGHDPLLMELVVGPLARKCAQCNVPLIYQSRRSVVARMTEQLTIPAGVRPLLHTEIDHVLRREGIDAYLLYETYVFTRHHQDGSFTGSEDMRNLLASRF